MPSNHLILVDCSAFAYRAFYQAAPLYRESDGQPIGAIIGFMTRLWELLGAAAADPPTHGAAIFDSRGLTFRHKLFPEYKANRPAARAVELENQFPFMRHAADALGLLPVEQKGFEADDVIATLATVAKRQGIRTTVVSPDKDFCQLVEDDVIEIVDPLNRRRVREADVKERFGVTPALVPDVQGLAGDPVDNIPGIKGCGLRRAADLVRRFGDLDGVLVSSKDCPWPMVRTQLRRAKDSAILSKQLATLRRDVKLPVKLDDLVLKPIMRSHLLEILRAIEAPEWAVSAFTGDVKLARPVEPVADPYEWHREELLASGQRIPNVPACGWYERRGRFKGPLLPARIWREAEIDPFTGAATGREILRCEVGARPADPFSEWARLSMAPISEKDFLKRKSANAGVPSASPEGGILAAPVPRNPRNRRQTA